MLSGVFSGISLPSIPDIGGMLSGALSGMFGGISLPKPPDIGAMLTGAMDGIFSGIALPKVPDVGAMINGALSGIFSGISLPQLPNIGGMISSMFSGISIPGFAGGVQNFQGGGMFGNLAVVGESGAELVVLPNGSSVYPSSSLSGGSGGLTSFGGGGGSSSAPQSISLVVQLDSQSILSAIGLPLSQSIRVAGGIRSY